MPNEEHWSVTNLGATIGESITFAAAIVGGLVALFEQHWHVLTWIVCTAVWVANSRGNRLLAEKWRRRAR